MILSHYDDIAVSAWHRNLDENMWPTRLKENGVLSYS